MTSIQDFKLTYDTNTSFGDNVRDNAESIVKSVAESLLTSLISGGGAAELAASPARGAKSTTDMAKSTADINATINIYNQIVNTLTKAVQDGTITMQECMGIINQCISDVEANDTEATNLNETLNKYQQENQELLQEINELSGGSFQKMSLGKDDENGNIADTEYTKTGKLNGGNGDRLTELIQKYQNNQNAISLIQSTISMIVQQISSKTTKGETEQQESLGFFEQLNSDVQNVATTSFNQLATNIKNTVSGGVQQQSQHALSTSNYGTADAQAAAKATATAAGKGILSAISGVFTAGIGAVLGAGSTAASTADAAAFTTASGLNKGFSLAAGGFKTVIQQLGTSLGNQFAQQISSNVNSLLGGNVSNIANSIENFNIGDVSIFLNQDDKKR